MVRDTLDNNAPISNALVAIILSAVTETFAFVPVADNFKFSNPFVAFDDNAALKLANVIYLLIKLSL
jgi:hypothetical protein